MQMGLTLPMLKIFSSKTQECKVLEKPLKPCRVGIHLKALAEYSQMSTHLPRFPEARLTTSFIDMDAWITSKLNVALISKLR